MERRWSGGKERRKEKGRGRLGDIDNFTLSGARQLQVQREIWGWRGPLL